MRINITMLKDKAIGLAKAAYANSYAYFALNLAALALGIVATAYAVSYFAPSTEVAKASKEIVEIEQAKLAQFERQASIANEVRVLEAKRDSLIDTLSGSIAEVRSMEKRQAELRSSIISSINGK